MAVEGVGGCGPAGRGPTEEALGDRLATLFEAALAAPQEQRQAFIASACGGDPSLRDELLSLLEAHDAASDYFDALSERVVAPALNAMASAPTEPSASETMERLQASLAETYRLERELGGAGMSRVFLAEDLRLGRRVVLKVLPPEMVPRAGAEHFRREIEVAARLQHAHIVPLLAADTANGMLYYTMPFVAGESLRERLVREGALPVDDALLIWRDVLDALAHAHASGVVHRDIKPGNILLSRRNALVIDFGIAGAIATASAGAQALAPGLAIGTPAYMAPEQITEGSESDERVDVYQAGLVMYEMLSGRLPFGAASPSELLSARVSGDPLPLLRAGAPAELVELVMRCLARAPAQRPPSADAVLAELEAAAETQATPSSVPGSSRHGAQRFAPLGAALLALAVATFVVRAPSQRPFAPPSLPPSAPRHVPDIAAHEAYARGMDLSLRRTDAGLQQAVEHFERAIAIDPLYAAPHAGLAIAYLARQNGAPAGEKRAWLARSEQAALRAVALGASDAEALTALGWVRLVTRDYEEAEEALTRAVALDPRVSRGHEGLARLYMMVGRPAEQLAHARAGLEVVPFSHSAIRELALALATNGRCEEAIERLRPLKSLTPPAGVAGVLSGQCYASLERWPEAIAELQWALDESDSAFALAFLSHALARGGRRDEAARILSDLLAGREHSHGAFGIATIYAGMREYDQAFAWLDQAIDEESVNPYIMHPVFADLHRDSRFRRVLERLGVPAP